MVRIIVVAHGEFATGILTSLRLIAGDTPDVHAINFEDGMSAQELRERIEQNISPDTNNLVLTDLLGGTPFKVSTEVSTQLPDNKVVVLSGLNLAILLDASFSRLTYDFDALISKLVRVGQEGIIDSLSLFNPKEEELVVFEDGI